MFRQTYYELNYESSETESTTDQESAIVPCEDQRELNQLWEINADN
jgi:hypothetical protein